MMKQTDILFLNPKQLLSLFIRQLPLVVALAKESSHAEMFCIRLKEYIQKHPNHNSKPAERILTLIRHNNTTIHELSTEKDVEINTITLLWEWLRGGIDNTITSDFILELYQQFVLLDTPDIQKPTAYKVATWMK